MDYIVCILLVTMVTLLQCSPNGVLGQDVNGTDQPNSTEAKIDTTTQKVAQPVGVARSSQTVKTESTTTTTVHQVVPTAATLPHLTPATIVTLPSPPKYPSLPMDQKIFKYLRLTRKSLYGHLLVSWDIQDNYVTQDVNYTLITEYFRVGDCADSTNLTRSKQEIPLQDMVRSYELQNVLSWSSLAVTLRGTEQTRGKTDYITETAVTHETVPVGKPTNIHPMSIQPNSAQIAWSPPACADRGGLRIKYDVELLAASAPANVKLMTTDTEYISLSALTPFTIYQIRVRYVNSAGTGPYSDYGVFQTGQGPPSAPIVYNFTYDDISIGVVIVLPVQPNGQIDQYNIELQGGVNHMSDLYTPLNGTEYIIGNLLPNTTYVIRARARNAAGWGDWSKPIQVSTKAEIKPSPLALRQTMANRTCIGFQWAPPNSDIQLVHAYEIRVFANDQVTLPIRTYVSHSNTEHVQCGLNPYTQYSVSVSVVKDTGQTGHPLGARMWTEGMTPPKPRPPVIRKETATTVTVELFPVLFDYGPITSYEIRLLRAYHNHTVRDPHPYGADNFGDDIPLWFLEDKAGSQEHNTKLNPSAHHAAPPVPEVPQDVGRGSNVPNVIAVGKRSADSKMAVEEEDADTNTYDSQDVSPIKTSTVFLLPVPEDKVRGCRLEDWFYEWRQVWLNSSDDRPRDTWSTSTGGSGCNVSSFQLDQRVLAEDFGNALSPPNKGRALKGRSESKTRKKRGFGSPPGVLWLELMANDIPEPSFWVIGDDKMYHGRRNLALEPDTEYTVIFAVKSTVVDITKHAYSIATTTAYTMPAEAPWLTEEQKMILLFAIIPICILLFCLFGFFVIRYLLMVTKNNKRTTGKPHSENSGDHSPEDMNTIDDDEDSNDDYMTSQKKILPGEQPMGTDKETAKLEKFFNPTQNVGQPRFITSMRENILYNDNNHKAENDGNNSAGATTRIVKFDSDGDSDSPDECSYSIPLDDPCPPAYSDLGDANNNECSMGMGAFRVQDGGGGGGDEFSTEKTKVLNYLVRLGYEQGLTEDLKLDDFECDDVKSFVWENDVTLVDMSDSDSYDSGLNVRLESCPCKELVNELCLGDLIGCDQSVSTRAPGSIRRFNSMEFGTCNEALSDYFNNNNNSIVNNFEKIPNSYFNIDFISDGINAHVGRKGNEIYDSVNGNIALLTCDHPFRSNKTLHEEPEHKQAGLGGFSTDPLQVEMSNSDPVTHAVGESPRECNPTMADNDNYKTTTHNGEGPQGDNGPAQGYVNDHVELCAHLCTKTHSEPLFKVVEHRNEFHTTKTIDETEKNNFSNANLCRELRAINVSSFFGSKSSKCGFSTCSSSASITSSCRRSSCSYSTKSEMLAHFEPGIILFDPIDQTMDCNKETRDFHDNGNPDQLEKSNFHCYYVTRNKNRCLCKKRKCLQFKKKNSSSWHKKGNGKVIKCVDFYQDREYHMHRGSEESCCLKHFNINSDITQNIVYSESDNELLDLARPSSRLNNNLVDKDHSCPCTSPFSSDVSRNLNNSCDADDADNREHKSGANMERELGDQAQPKRREPKTGDVSGHAPKESKTSAKKSPMKSGVDDRLRERHKRSRLRFDLRQSNKERKGKKDLAKEQSSVERLAKKDKNIKVRKMPGVKAGKYRGLGAIFFRKGTKSMKENKKMGKLKNVPLAPEKSNKQASGMNDSDKDESSNNPVRRRPEPSESEETESDTESGEDSESSSGETETETLSESESDDDDEKRVRKSKRPSPLVNFTGENEPFPQYPVPPMPPMPPPQPAPKRKWYHILPFFRKAAQRTTLGTEYSSGREYQSVQRSASDNTLRVNRNTFQQQPVQFQPPLIIAQYPTVQAMVSPRLYSSVPQQMMVLPQVTAVAPPISPYAGPRRNVNWSRKTETNTRGIRPMSENVSFRDEFISLEKFKQSLLHKFTYNVAQRNLDKNRFPYILAPDHTRVNVEIVAAGDADYYNASYIRLDSDIQFIAAQTPFSPITVSDFWRMVLQNRVETIVMLCACVEGGVIKSEQYWADAGVYAGGHVLVETISQKWFANFVIRTFKLSAACSADVKVTQFQFFSWPLNGVPDDPIPFLELRYRVRSFYGRRTSPILVICGTGVARSAVFIAVDQLIEEYGRDGSVNVYRFVKKMRRSRPFMVRNLNQYRFIYECLLEEFQAGDTVLRLDMKHQYRALCQKNPQSDFTFLMDQFRILCQFTPDLTHKDCSVGLLKTNMSKNVNQKVLPPDKYRPYSKVNEGDPSTWPYINAVVIDGHRRAEEFILTQIPLINTAFDFWKMVHDYQIQTIVMFGKCRGLNQEQYFPKTGGRQFGNLYVEHINTTKTDSFTTRNLKICVSGLAGLEKRALRHFQVKQWDDGESLQSKRIDQFPNGITDLLDLTEKVLDWQVVANRRTKPVVVVCIDGATLSGLFVSCLVICEKMREDKEVDLYHTVKHIKRRRPKIISDFDQYRLLHQILWEYIVNYLPEARKLVQLEVQEDSSSGSDNGVQQVEVDREFQFTPTTSPTSRSYRERAMPLPRRYSPEKKEDHEWLMADDYSDTQVLGVTERARNLSRRESSTRRSEAQPAFSWNQSAVSSSHSLEKAPGMCACLPICRKKGTPQKGSSSKIVTSAADEEEDFHPRNLRSIRHELGGKPLQAPQDRPRTSLIDRASENFEEILPRKFDERTNALNKDIDEMAIEPQTRGSKNMSRDYSSRRRRLSSEERIYVDGHSDMFIGHFLKVKSKRTARTFVDTATGSDTVIPTRSRTPFVRLEATPRSEQFDCNEEEDMFRELYSTRASSELYRTRENTRISNLHVDGDALSSDMTIEQANRSYRKASTLGNMFHSSDQNDDCVELREFYANQKEGLEYLPPRPNARADSFSQRRYSFQPSNEHVLANMHDNCRDLNVEDDNGDKPKTWPREVVKPFPSRLSSSQERFYKSDMYGDIQTDPIQNLTNEAPIELRRSAAKIDIFSRESSLTNTTLHEGTSAQRRSTEKYENNRRMSDDQPIKTASRFRPENEVALSSYRMSPTRPLPGSPTVSFKMSNMQFPDQPDRLTSEIPIKGRASSDGNVPKLTKFSYTEPNIKSRRTSVLQENQFDSDDVKPQVLEKRDNPRQDEMTFPERLTAHRDSYLQKRALNTFRPLTPDNLRKEITSPSKASYLDVAPEYQQLWDKKATNAAPLQDAVQTAETENRSSREFTTSSSSISVFTSTQDSEAMAVEDLDPVEVERDAVLPRHQDSMAVPATFQRRQNSLRNPEFGETRQDQHLTRGETVQEVGGFDSPGNASSARRITFQKELTKKKPSPTDVRRGSGASQRVTQVQCRPLPSPQTRSPALPKCDHGSKMHSDNRDCVQEFRMTDDTDDTEAQWTNSEDFSVMSPPRKECRNNDRMNRKETVAEKNKRQREVTNKYKDSSNKDCKKRTNAPVVASMSPDVGGRGAQVTASRREPITVKSLNHRDPSYEDMWVDAKVTKCVGEEMDNSFDNSSSSEYDVSIHLK